MSRNKNAAPAVAAAESGKREKALSQHLTLVLNFTPRENDRQLFLLSRVVPIIVNGAKDGKLFSLADLATLCNRSRKTVDRHAVEEDILILHELFKDGLTITVCYGSQEE